MDKLATHEPLVALEQPGEYGVRITGLCRPAGGQSGRGEGERGCADRQPGEPHELTAGRVVSLQIVHEAIVALLEGRQRLGRREAELEFFHLSSLEKGEVHTRTAMVWIIIVNCLVVAIE